MKYRLLRWSAVFWLIMIGGCGPQRLVKNPGNGVTQESGWVDTLRIDPAARIGTVFWISYAIDGAADAIDATTITFDLPAPLTLVRGQRTYSNLQFQQNEGYTATIWVRIDHLDAPVIIRARAEGVFHTTQQPADSGSGRYLIAQDGAIRAVTDLP